jgi:predicted metalloprotease with PDZ domain
MTAHRLGSLPGLVAIGLSTALAPAWGAVPKSKPASSWIQLEVDARDAPRGTLRARLGIPARPGALKLVYPKWIPGEHSPSGPINGMIGLRMSAGGRPVAWRRDDEDMYVFHVTVPPAANRVDVELEYLSPVETGRFSAGAGTTSNLAMVSWNQLVLVPAGAAAADVVVAAHLRLPAGWDFGTALPLDRRDDAGARFQPVSLETLIDSPVLAGRYFRVVPLDGGDPPRVEIAIACDGEAGLAMTPDHRSSYERLVRETDALFGVRHFERYRFLLTLSDHTAHFGLEHHASSDNRVPERALIDSALRTRMATLLPHEYVHSWNGKYRRPAGLATPDYQTPMHGEMLWVYEGLTQYLAWILTARSGLRPPEQAREQLADAAAYLDGRPGRAWRPLRDTAVGAQLVFAAPTAGAEARRANDFYNEGLLIWLEADVTLRRLTHGQRSLDDFCRRFYAGKGGEARVVPYDLDDIVAELGAVAEHDWRGFFAARVDVATPHAPLGGVEQGGWRLAWSDSVPALQKAFEDATKSLELRYSIGVKLGDDGKVEDIVPGQPAAAAGVAAGDALVAVNGRRWTPKVLREAIAATRTGAPLDLLVQRGEFYATHRLDYRGGERYPVLERDAATPDLLDAILAPQSTASTALGR